MQSADRKSAKNIFFTFSQARKKQKSSFSPPVAIFVAKKNKNFANAENVFQHLLSCGALKESPNASKNNSLTVKMLF